jgi:hypothetical protein
LDAGARFTALDECPGGGRFTIDADPEELVNHFDLDKPPAHAPTLNKATVKGPELVKPLGAA